jgi:peptidoglycan hydrolase-like protein with peptidoglycan-binding domain
MAHLGTNLAALLTTTVAIGGLVATAQPAAAARTTVVAQRLLNDAGCDAGTPDGSFGTRSRAAVLKFQAANGLAQTSTLGSTTWSKLESSHKVRCDRRPVPSASGSGARIVVSRTQNYLWLVRSDGSVRWQGGFIDDPTVFSARTYRSGADCGRSAHLRWNSDYSKGLWLEHYTRIQTGLCGVGFHRVPEYKSSGNQIHPDWYLGTNLKQSHGCLRVSARTAREIWDFTQGSVPVVFKA